MRLKLLIFAILLSFAAGAQSWQPINAKQRFNKGLGLPILDTLPGTAADTAQIILRPADSTIYYKYKGFWRSIGSITEAYYTLDSIAPNTVVFRSNTGIADTLYFVSSGEGGGGGGRFGIEDTTGDQARAMDLQGNDFAITKYGLLDISNWGTDAVTHYQAIQNSVAANVSIRARSGDESNPATHVYQTYIDLSASHDDNESSNLTLFAGRRRNIYPEVLKAKTLTLNAEKFGLVTDFNDTVGTFKPVILSINGQLADNDGNINIETGTSYTAGSGLVLQGAQFKIQDTLNGLHGSAKLIWMPGKYAFRAGRSFNQIMDVDSIGINSAGFGYNIKATGQSSFVAGNSSTASGFGSAVFGSGNTASGSTSFAAGSAAFASGQTSVAMGNLVYSIGLSSVAMGYSAVASGNYSFAAGAVDSAFGTYSFAMGNNNKAYGYSSAAFGSSVFSKGFAGFAVGSYNDSTNAANETTFNTLNRAFQIGIGNNPANRKNAMTVLFSGKTTLNQYGVGTFTGTAAKWLAVTSTGDVIEQAPPSSYTFYNGLTESGGTVQWGGTNADVTLTGNGASAIKSFNNFRWMLVNNSSEWGDGGKFEMRGASTFATTISQQNSTYYSNIQIQGLDDLNNYVQLYSGKGGTTKTLQVKWDAISIIGLPNYTDNADAVTNGAAVNTIYRSGDYIKIVH